MKKPKEAGDAKKHRKDLVVLVADRDIEQAVLSLLARPQALCIRPVSCDLVVHPNRDPGCHGTSGQLLVGYEQTNTHALVMFDLAWMGAPSRDPRVLEEKVRGDLRSAWGDRGDCVVIDPEIEVWVFSDSPNVDESLGWSGRSPPLRAWLQAHEHWKPRNPKPADPKAAFEAALRHARRPASSAIFRTLASTVSLERCADPSFARFVGVMRRWFPAAATQDAERG